MHLLLSVLILASGSVAGGEKADTTETERRSTLQARRVDTPPTVDGRLSETTWSGARAATAFRQLQPREGAAPSQRTAVKVLYGSDALYIGAELHDNRPGRIRDRLARRDQRNEADWFEVSIDSYLDRQTARTFAVNAAGVQRDGIVQGGGVNPVDPSWDAIWDSAVRITDRGWVAELRIPYDMLRFDEGGQQRWGLQFRRRIPRTGEILEWPLTPSAERRSSLVAGYGRLTDLRGLTPERRLQVSPYTLGRLQSTEDADPQNQFRRRSGIDVGGEFEIGVGANALLEGTINPDFGQVESDPAVLNLTAFETFFDERRPFFIDETDVFNFPVGFRSELFYSRRIGAEAPVVGALKLTGRTPDGLLYGGMAATTGTDFRPTRNYGVGHVQKQIGTISTVGAMMTAYDGPLASADEEGDRDVGGRRRSVSGGVNWDLRLSDNTIQLGGHLSGTHRRGTTGDVAPSTGVSLNTEIGRIRRDWNFNVGFRLRDDEYNPNDLGRLRENNFFQISSFHTYQFNGGQPVGPFQRLSGNFNFDHSWSYRKRHSLGIFTFQQFDVLTQNFRPVSLRVEGDYLGGGIDLFETRGLGPRERPTRGTVRLSVGTDTRRDWQLTPRVSWTARTDGGRAWSAGLDTEWNVGSRLKLSAGLGYRRELWTLEWAANETFVRRGPGRWAEAALGSAPTYYAPVYGRRDTERLDLTMRANVALTTDLSFEFFGQLFGARGRYRDSRVLSAPDDLSEFEAYPRRHDFARSSFIANAVVRWEFRPGSELFAVWSQDRRVSRDDPFFRDQRADSPYARPAGRRLGDALRAGASNAFILKLRYTLR